MLIIKAVLVLLNQSHYNTFPENHRDGDGARSTDWRPVSKVVTLNIETYLSNTPDLDYFCTHDKHPSTVSSVYVTIKGGKMVTCVRMCTRGGDGGFLITSLVFTLLLPNGRKFKMNNFQNPTIHSPIFYFN